jgi:penicillin G amidase
MKFLKPLLSLAITIGLVYFLHNSWGVLPPLGRLFSPFEGFWQNAEKDVEATNNELALEGLKGIVTVKYDDNRVPHIFAENDDDLYMAQGYIIARDRLWQMEFYTLAASGRLTEAVGPTALEYDRYNRRLGMANAAKEIIKKLESDPLSMQVLTSYSAGVNAFIQEASYKKLPIEYKILNYQPEAWSPYKTVLMLMNMRNVLNGGSDDYRITNIVSKYGLEAVKDLFPDYPSIESPIIPSGTAWKTPVKVPTPPTEIMASTEQIAMNIPEPRPQIGSNNWAVGGEKSATGLPILANDPHLTLSLPSIWYQMQLHSPNVNVYGVALPGAPGITIGFNKDIAWGVTNVGSDVMDFYNIKFKDQTKSEYWYEGAWKPIKKLVEIHKIKGMPDVVDTLLYTHHGPIIYSVASDANFNKNVPIGHAMRWVGHESDGSDMLAFYYLNRAKNYDDYRKALTYYTAPAQNFIFASNQNDIAITPNGKLPLKWKGQGKYILDGSKASHDWQGWIPKDQNPYVKNPPRGFVSSANQFSTDPTYPYYLGWKFAPAYRGIRINERLDAMKQATIDSLRMLQNDNFNVAARMILPELLKTLSTDATISKLPTYQALASWNMQNDANSAATSIFEAMLQNVGRFIWDDEFPIEKGMMHPTEDRTFQLIKSTPTSKWYDDITTKDKVETLADAIKKSFTAATDTLTVHNGSFNPETWAWNKVKSTDIKHLVPAFASFSRMDIVNGGGKGIVNATTERTGPSWRMVVQLDKGWPKGYGLYPGGQSGNPGSKYYDNMIDKWAAGELNELLFLKDANETSEKIKSTLQLKKK